MLEMFAAGKVVAAARSRRSTTPRPPFDGVPCPAVAMAVSYVDGVTGGNVFVITLDGARKLAAAMMGMDQPEDPDAPELSELELSAVVEAMNQMMASAAAATSVVLGTEVEIGTPETQDLHRRRRDRRRLPADAARRAHGDHGLRRARRLVQLVPNAFVVRMTSALDDIGSEVAGARRRRRRRGRRRRAPSLAGIPVRVWAELGRARMPSAQVVGLPTGAVVELDSRPTTRSTSSSTARTSPPAAWWSSTAPTGPCASSTSSSQPNHH